MDPTVAQVTIRGRHRLAATVVFAAIGTACGGGEGEHSNVHPRVSGRPQASSSPLNTTIRRPVHASPAVVLPQPKVIDRGTDVVAVVRSLLLFGRWLEWHNPDPALVARVFRVGSPPERVVSRHATELRRIGARIVEVDGAPMEFKIISLKQNVVTFRLTEHLLHRELIAANGHIRARDKARIEQYLISIARSSYEAPWRVNLVERQNGKIEIQL